LRVASPYIEFDFVQPVGAVRCLLNGSASYGLIQFDGEVGPTLRRVGIEFVGFVRADFVIVSI